MLLRAGLIYALAVSTLLFEPSRFGRTSNSMRSARPIWGWRRAWSCLTAQLDAAKVNLSTAERKALVAEDALERVLGGASPPGISALPETPAPASSELESAMRELTPPATRRCCSPMT